VQLCGRHSALIAWKPGSGAAQHHAAWQRRQEAMPVAIVLGAPPLLQWAAAAPLPPDLDEAALASLFSGESLALSQCDSCDLPVPASAEAVIEGTILPGASGLEGPFGNHTGTYSLPASVPRLELTTMYRRRDMFYPCTVVGPPPMEDCYLAEQTVRLFLPLLQCDLPQVVDLAMPLEGIFHGCALVAVHGDDDGRELCAALRRTPLLHRSRLLVLVDGTVDVHDSSRVFWAALNRVQLQRDLYITADFMDIDARRGSASALAIAPQTLALLRCRRGEYGLPEQWLG